MRSWHFSARHVREALLLIVLGTMLQAQVAAYQAQQSHKAVAEVIIRGCMQPGAERTTLTDPTGTTYLLRQIQVSSQKREFVEVHGQQLPPAGQHGEAALPEIHVISMRTLSNICPEKILPQPLNPKTASPGAQSPATPPYHSPNIPHPQPGAPVLNTPRAGGAPSPGTGNPQDQQPTPK